MFTFVINLKELSTNREVLIISRNEKKRVSGLDSINNQLETGC